MLMQVSISSNKAVEMGIWIMLAVNVYARINYDKQLHCHCEAALFICRSESVQHATLIRPNNIGTTEPFVGKADHFTARVTIDVRQYGCHYVWNGFFTLPPPG